LSELNAERSALSDNVILAMRKHMSQTERFAHLLHELERVGVDPDTLSAGLAVSEDEALRALAALPDNAGPSAFLAQLRIVTTQHAKS
jgi:hypothetical protein